MVFIIEQRDKVDADADAGRRMRGAGCGCRSAGCGRTYNAAMLQFSVFYNFVPSYCLHLQIQPFVCGIGLFVQSREWWQLVYGASRLGGRPSFDPLLARLIASPCADRVA